MKAPQFWFSPPDRLAWQSIALTPVSKIFAWATAIRVARNPKLDPDIPVICIGNLNLGGSGKTPTAIAISQRLIDRGSHPHFVSRGYGGSLSGPVQVDEKLHRADDVGDEPLLLAAFAPTWIARDRAAAVAAAQSAGADVVILDDGFQNPSVAKDVSIVVADANVGFGNGRVFPSGPLRESIHKGLKRADILLTIGGTKHQQEFSARWSDQISVPHCTGELIALKTGMDWQGLRTFAFAGIGHPEKFFATLRELGANLVQTKALDDHQTYGNAMLARLTAEATKLDAQLVTTEKDAARLPPEFLPQILALVVRLNLSDWTAIDRALDGLGLQSRN